MMLIFFSCSTVNDLNSEAIITVTPDKYLGGTNRYSDIYRQKDGKCRIEWTVSGRRDKAKFYLSLSYSDGAQCPSFEAQVLEHKNIFSKILEHKRFEDIISISTPPFYLVQPNYSWNKTIAEEAIDNALWVDYVRNYPNQKFGRSSNSIFVEIANKTNSYRELQDFFDYYSVKIRLVSVEKVFAMWRSKLPFNIRGKSTSGRIMYDAGTLVYEVK